MLKLNFADFTNMGPGGSAATERVIQPVSAGAKKPWTYAVRNIGSATVTLKYAITKTGPWNDLVSVTEDGGEVADITEHAFIQITGSGTPGAGGVDVEFY